MRNLKSAGVALATLLCAVSFTATAEARKGNGGHNGGGHHGGHHSHNHGGGHGHHGYNRGFRGRGFGIGLYAPTYGYYDDGPDDCYRVYRRGRTRVVCN